MPYLNGKPSKCYRYANSTLSNFPNDETCDIKFDHEKRIQCNEFVYRTDEVSILNDVSIYVLVVQRTSSYKYLRRIPTIYILRWMYLYIAPSPTPKSMKPLFRSLRVCDCHGSLAQTRKNQKINRKYGIFVWDLPPDVWLLLFIFSKFLVSPSLCSAAMTAEIPKTPYRPTVSSISKWEGWALVTLLYTA